MRPTMCTGTGPVQKARRVADSRRAWRRQDDPTGFHTFASHNNMTV